MATATTRPTRREQRRVETVQEIKARAMEQIRAGGPDAVSLARIVRDMSMSPAAVYRYFASRDALVGDLVVDAYDELADFLVASAPPGGPADEGLRAVLGAVRTWALAHPNAYRLIFQTEVGSGREVEVERTTSAATRSMAAIIAALATVSTQETTGTATTSAILPPSLDAPIAAWSRRSGLDGYPPDVLALGLLSWTRLHGIISLELAGHLPATGLDASVLYDAEVTAITLAAAPHAPTTPPSRSGQTPPA